MKLRLALLPFIAVIAAGCGGTSAPPTNRSSGPEVVELASVQRQVEGKPVVYLFTAPGCASCAAQARALVEAAHSRSTVQLVGVDLSNDSPGGFAAYIRRIGLAGSPFVWTIDEDGTLARQYGIVNLSSTVFIGSDGKVRFTNPGPTAATTLSGQLRQLS